MPSEEIILTVGDLLAAQQGNPPKLSRVQKEDILEANTPSIASSKQPSSSQMSGCVPSVASLSPQLSKMVQQMRSTLEIRDRCFNNKMYSTCFSAVIAVDWLLINGYVDSRKEGVNLCQKLLDSQVIVSLTSSKTKFGDTGDLYIFKADQQTISRQPFAGNSLFVFAPHVKSNSIVLSHPKATLLEAAVNGRDIVQLRKLLSELRQQAVYHLLFQSGGEWRQKKRIDRYGNYILMEKPATPKGNYTILRSTREISGDAGEVYRDLLLGDIVSPSARGRYRWEKRLSHEEVLAVVEDVANEEKVPFVKNLIASKTSHRKASSRQEREKPAGASVILEEWRKLGGVYRGGRTFTDIPKGVRILHRTMKSTSGFASSRDLLLLQDHFRTEDGCYVIYEISINGELPSTASKQNYVRAEVLLCSYLIIPSGRDKCRLNILCQYNDFQSLLLMLLKTRPLITCDVTGFRHTPLGSKPLLPETPSSASEAVDPVSQSLPTTPPPPTPMESAPVEKTEVVHEPVTLEDFQVKALLGRGGYGKVFHVYNAKTDRYYAMKVLKKEEIVRRRQVARTKVERLILERANFPFITKLHYAYQTPYRLYFVMDYMQCGDLFTHLSRFGIFSEETTRLYMAEIVLALEHLHAMGIIFRDLKPENVLLGADGHIKLADFGLSRYYNLQLDEQRPIGELRSYSYCGTEQYMAPEMLLRRPHTEAIDWWALGILMCECLTGYHPFQGHSHHHTLNNMMNAMVTPRLHGLSMDARSLILRLLDRDPAKRIGSDENGVKGLKAHPFFASINWTAVLRKDVRVPTIPRVDGPMDYTYFDRSLVRPVPRESTCSPQLPPSEMELKLRILREKERQAIDNPHKHPRTRTPSLELDTRYLGFEYSCD